MTDPLQQLIEGIRQAQPAARNVPLLQSRRVQIAIVAAACVIVTEALRLYGVDVGDDTINRLLAIAGALIGGDTVRGLGRRDPKKEDEPV